MSYRESIRYCCEDLLGPIPTEQLGTLTAICAGVEQELLARLRKDAEVETFADTFILAAAMLSVSLLRETENQGLSEFTAATMKLSFSESRSHLATLAYRLLEPWSADGFAFRGVRA